MTRLLLLAVIVAALAPERSFAACADPGAVAATRAAADQACTAMGAGCSTARNHGDYVSCIAHQAKAAVKAGTLPKACKGAVVRCAAQSTCGKPGFVTCCRTNKQGKTSCAIKHGSCKAPKHGTACVGTTPSCCDACVGASCAQATTTTTTILATTTTATNSTTTTTIPNCTVAGNLVQNCGFETPAESPGNYANFGPGDTSITGWTVVTTPPGGVDLTTKTFAGGFPVHGGMQSLDLNHDNPGGISQAIATTAGQPYQLTFFLSGYPAASAPCSASDPKMLTVTAGSASANYSFTPDTHASPPGNQQFVQETLAFTGAGGSSTTLTFTGTNSGCAGPIIDDVIVVPGP